MPSLLYQTKRKNLLLYKELNLTAVKMCTSLVNLFCPSENIISSFKTMTLKRDGKL